MRSKRRLRLPSPAMTVALVALFVALSGSALAVGSTIVPLAKRAMTADRAKLADKSTLAVNATNAGHALTADSAAKLGAAGSASVVQQAVAQAIKTPGPASTAAGLVTVKSAQWSVAPGSHTDQVVTCDAGQKAIAGGWDDPGGWSHPWDTRPTPDGGGWATFVTSSSNAPGQQTGSLYVVCLK